MNGNRIVVCVLIVAVMSWPAARAHANNSSSTMIVFGRSGTNSPYCATWSGSAWSSVSSLPSVGALPYWVMSRNCPTRNETVALTFDNASDVNVTFFNGSSWSSVTEVCTDSDEIDDRNADVNYEQQSGDCLIVYYDSANTRFGYRTYSGSSLSSQQILSHSTMTGNDTITLYPKSGSDQIMMITLGQVNGSDPVICACLWSGSSWGSWTTIETTAPSNDDDCYDFAWESVSGRGMLVYGENGSNSPRYRTFSSSTWSSESSLPSTGGAPWWVRVVADPASNKMLFAGLDAGDDINVNSWSGSAWGANLEIETDAPGHDRRAFDVTYEPAGTKGLIAYGEVSQSRLRYRTWSGSSWSSEVTSTDLAQTPRTVQLQKGIATGEIFVAANDDGDDIELMRWNGSSMSSKTQIEGTHSGLNTTEPFMIAVASITPLTPANTPYFTDFEGTVGPEWSYQTSTYSASYGKFLGEFNGFAIQLALNTTVNETYTVTFDLYANDSWDGDNTTYGPDAFIVSANGAEIFDYTIENNNPGYGQSYPYPPDQRGALGFSSSFQDSIFRTIEATFIATTSVTTIAFSDSLVDTSPGIANESWAIDNVRVRSAPFLNVTTSKGFNVNTSTNSDLYGSGQLWGDIDGDGDLDAVLLGNTAKVMLNNSAGASFTNFYGSTAVFACRQGAFLDADNDGDLDIWLACYSSGVDTERFFRNVGPSSYFTDGGAAGVTAPTNNEGVAAADLDHDGWCDVAMFSGSGNYLCFNQKSTAPTFSASSSSTYGMNTSGDFGVGDYCSSSDVNKDGYPDFFYHYNSGKLFVSSGSGTWPRNNYGISITTGSGNTIGSAWGDYDNDGDMDLFAARYSEACTGYLWRNDRNWSAGSGNFTNQTAAAGLNLNTVIDYSPDLPGTRSGCWGDTDNDGDLDLFIVGANGNPYFYENQGDGTFKNVGMGVTYSGEGQDACFVDYDNDGDLDLCITRTNASALLFHNRTNNSNYLKVRLVGLGDGKTNKAAVGTRVELWNSAGTTLLAVREAGVAKGYGGTEPLWMHFGGVTPSATYRIKVYFDSKPMTAPYATTVVPQSTSTVIGSRTIPQMLTVTEPPGMKVVKWRETINRAS